MSFLSCYGTSVGYRLSVAYYATVVYDDSVRKRDNQWAIARFCRLGNRSGKLLGDEAWSRQGGEQRGAV
ncbi:MAG: hypothetical protein J2P36_09755 [Ktedonobacteraceae bacterium]|nr:hypothetical protein [Ktedonobacteraceae bacterium]